MTEKHGKRYKPEEIKRTVVVPDGDVELWTVSGKLADGFEWTIPLKLKPYLTRNAPNSETGSANSESFRVPRSDFPVRYYFKPVEHWSNAFQYDVLCEVLDKYDHSPQDERGWWFSHETMLKFAKKAPGITPEYYERWPVNALLADSGDGFLTDGAPASDPAANADQTVESTRRIPYSDQELRFLKHLQSITGQMSWEAMKILWMTIRQAAVKWLAEDRKTLDLGFARLVPVPYRANWKEALAVRFGPYLSKFRKTRKWDLGSRNSAFRDPPSEFDQFQAALSSVKLLALDKQHHFAHWSVETILSHDLNRAFEENEYARFQKLGPTAYARHLLGQLARRADEITTVFWRYVDKVLLPPAKLVDGDRGTTRLIPEIKPGAVHPMKGVTARLDLVPAKAFEKWNVDELGTHPKLGNANAEPGIPSSEFRDPTSGFRVPAFLADVPAMQVSTNGARAAEFEPERALNGVEGDRDGS